MAEEWQAVLLIDEADVYLQQRGLGGSLEREAIVAGKPVLIFDPVSTFLNASLNSLSESLGILSRHSLSHIKLCWQV